MIIAPFKTNNGTVLHIGKKNIDLIGNSLVFHNEIFDYNNTHRLGTNQGRCIRMKTGKNGKWECYWSIILNDGQISVQGPFLDAENSVLAITGGTGKYNNSGGEMEIHHRILPNEFLFIYHIKDKEVRSTGHPVSESKSNKLLFYIILTGGGLGLAVLVCLFCRQNPSPKPKPREEREPLIIVGGQRGYQSTD